MIESKNSERIIWAAAIGLAIGVGIGFFWGQWVGYNDRAALAPPARQSCSPRTSLVVATQSGEVLLCLNGSNRRRIVQ